MKGSAPWPTPFLSTFTSPWTCAQTHMTPSHGSTNNGDICERCFPKCNVLKNVFPACHPISHNLSRSLGNNAHCRKQRKKTVFLRGKESPWRVRGSTCAVCNEERGAERQASTWRGWGLPTSDAAGWETQTRLSLKVLTEKARVLGSWRLGGSWMGVAGGGWRRGWWCYSVPV